MSADEREFMGNLSVERGGHYAKRTWRDLKPRQVRIPDASFDTKVRGVYAGLHANGGSGPYASRRIANIAQGEQEHSLRFVFGDVLDAIEAGVPLGRIEQVAFVLLDEIRQRHAQRVRMASDRPEPPTPSGGALPAPMTSTGEFAKAS